MKSRNIQGFRGTKVLAGFARPLHVNEYILGFQYNLYKEKADSLYEGIVFFLQDLMDIL